MATKEEQRLQNINTGETITADPTQPLADVGFVPVAPPDPTKLDSTILTPEPDMQFQSPPPETIFPVKDLDTTPPLALTPTETETQDFTSQLQDINRQLLGESAFRAEQETAQGLPELQKTQTDLTSQLKAIQNEAKAIPLQLQQEATGRGITAGGLAPLQTARLRTNAIQALGVNSLLEASRGNIATAQTMVDRAVAQKFDPIKEERNALISNLNLVLQSPQYSLEQKNRAQRQLDIQNAKAEQDKKDEENQKTIWNLAAEAAQTGTLNAVQLKQIQDAKTPEEALRIATGLGVFEKPEEAVAATSPDLEFIKGTSTQQSGVFNKLTGEFTPMGGGGRAPSLPGTVSTSGGREAVVAGIDESGRQIDEDGRYTDDVELGFNEKIDINKIPELGGKQITNKTARDGNLPFGITDRQADWIIQHRAGNVQFQQLKSSEFEKLADLFELRDDLNEIKALKEQVNTGPLASRTKRGLRFLGKEDPKFNELEIKTGKQLAEFIKEISGAAVSEQEAQRLARLVPNVGMQDQQFGTSIKDLEDDLNNLISAKVNQFDLFDEDELREAVFGGRAVQPNINEEGQTAEDILKEFNIQ